MTSYFSVDAVHEDSLDTYYIHSEEVDDPKLEAVLQNVATGGGVAAVAQAIARPKRAYVYRKMSEREFCAAVEKKGMPYSRSRHRQRGEKWVTESLQHTRQFNNTAARGKNR